MVNTIKIVKKVLTEQKRQTIIYLESLLRKKEEIIQKIESCGKKCTSKEYDELAEIEKKIKEAKEKLAKINERLEEISN